ncbi:MAG: glycosyltransferase family 4 protein, partial [Parahaliea sp.]
IAVLVTGVDSSTYPPAAGKDRELAREYQLEGKFVIGYIGTHGMAHALDKVLEAARLLEQERDIRFLFAGGGAEREKLEKLATQSKLANVVMMPRQPKDRMPAVWSLCDISLISLRDTPLFTKVIPSKIFESMGMALPMIIACPSGEATGIIASSGSGLVVKSEDPKALAEGVLSLYRDRGRLAELSRASLASASDYDRSAQAQLMLKSLAGVAVA